MWTDELERWAQQQGQLPGNLTTVRQTMQRESLTSHGPVRPAGAAARRGSARGTEGERRRRVRDPGVRIHTWMQFGGAAWRDGAGKNNCCHTAVGGLVGEINRLPPGELTKVPTAAVTWCQPMGTYACTRSPDSESLILNLTQRGKALAAAYASRSNSPESIL